VIVYYGNEQFKTKILNGQGSRPVWNETFRFHKCADLMLRLEVWDRDLIGHDDLIGEGHINLYTLLANPAGEMLEYPIETYYDGKYAGRIIVTVRQQPGGLLAHQLMQTQQQLQPVRMASSLPVGTYQSYQSFTPPPSVTYPPQFYQSQQTVVIPTSNQNIYAASPQRYYY
jgi:hypothetical protein